VLSGPAYDRLSNSAITELVITDTIPLKEPHDKIRVLSVADLFASVMKSVNSNQSISGHFLF
jgi:ribose-phosphate pyrophosphokinase